MSNMNPTIKQILPLIVAAVLFCAILSKTVTVRGEKTMLDAQLPQTFTELTPEDQEFLNSAREHGKAVITPESLEKLSTVAGKVGTAKAIYEARLWEKDPQYIDVIAVMFGDAFNQELGTHWAVVSDDYGEELIIKYPGIKIMAAPFSMIRKRIERNEEMDLIYMFNWTCEQLENMRESEEYASDE